MRRAYFAGLAASALMTANVHAIDRWCNGFNDSLFCDDFDRDCVVSQQPPPPAACPAGSSKGDAQLRGTWRHTSFVYNTGQIDGANMNVEQIQGILPTAPFGGRHPCSGDEGMWLGQNTVDLTNYIAAAMPGYDVANGSDSDPLVLTFTMGALAKGAMQFNEGYMELSLNDPDRWHPVTDPAKAVTDWILVGGDDGSGCIDCLHSCPGGQAAASNPWPTICQQEFPHAACPPKMTVVRTALAVGAMALLDNNPCHCCPSPAPLAGCDGTFATPGYALQCPAEYRTAEFPDGWQEPTNWHLSYFDGLEWRVLKAGMGGPGSYGDFRYGNYWIHLKNKCGQYVGNTDSAWETVVLTIKANTVDIYHKTKNVDLVDGQWVESDVESMAYDLPRHYAGGFNRLRAGTDEACQLIEQGDPSYDGTYKCDRGYANGQRRPKAMKEDSCGGAAMAKYRSSAVSFDNVRMYGGIGVTGACCLSNGSCSVMTPSECAAAQGVFRGSGTPCDGSRCLGACCQPRAECAQTLVTSCSGRFRGVGTDCNAPCCPSPFADWDGDRDVDTTDFAALQRCLTIGGGAIEEGCFCFDHNANGAIDANDVLSFVDCATGPSVVAESVPSQCAP